MTEEKRCVTPQQKLNEALGIEPEGTVDDVISSLNEELSEIEVSLKKSIQKVDNALERQDGTTHNLEQALGELSTLIGNSRGMIEEVYDYVKRSEIMDPDVIRSGADLIKASTEIVREYVELYKEKMRHYQSIEMEMIKHENKKELERYKHELKSGGKNITDNNTIEYRQEEVVKAIDTYDKSKK